jgi:hypothetical protein
MDVLAPVKKWVFGIALKKMIVSAAKLVVSGAATHGIAVSATMNGIAIDTSNQAVMVVAINSVLGMIRNFLKLKWPEKFGWM